MNRPQSKSVSPASGYLKTERFEPLAGVEILHLHVDSKDESYKLVNTPPAPTHKPKPIKCCSCFDCFRRLFSKQTSDDKPR